MPVETLFWWERVRMYKIKWIYFGYMNIRGCFNISPLRLRNLWSRKQWQGRDEIPSCLTPWSKWHSFTNMGILCFYSVLHNVYLSRHVRQVHCVSGTGKSTQTQCIGLKSWDKVHFCNSTTNTFTTDQGVETEKLVDGWGTPYFTSCPYRLPTVRKALSIVCLWWKLYKTKYLRSIAVKILSFNCTKTQDQNGEDMFHRT